MARGRVLVVDDHLELAQLIASALEGRSLQVHVCLNGGAALSELRTHRFAAAVVDLLLPDMLGTDILDALAACDPPVPAIAISGVFRGRSGYHEAVTRHRATAFLEKPFNTQALVQTIADLAQLQPGADEAPEDVEEALIEAELAETVPDHGAVAGDEPLFVDTAEPEIPAAAAPPHRPPLTADDIDLDEVDEGHDRHGLEELEPLDEAEVLPEPAAPVGPSLEEKRAQKRLGFVEDLVGAPSPAAAPAPSGVPPTRPPPPARSRRDEPPPTSGELTDTSVPRLLAAAHQTRLTGQLVLRRDPMTKAIYLRAGEPHFAASNVAGDRLLTFAVKQGRVSREDAQAALRLAREEDRRVGDLLIDLELLDKDGLRELVADQVRAIIWSTFAWADGSYRIRPEEAPPRRPVVELPLAATVIDGLGAVLPLVELRRRLPDEVVLAPRADPVVSLEALTLTEPQARLVVAADGTKSVEDLITLSDEEERDVRCPLLALWSFGVLAPRDQMLASARRMGFVL